MSKLSRVKKDRCSICGEEYEPDTGGIQGNFGILPVTFCEWCLPSMLDMAQQILEDEEIYVRKPNEH